MVGPCRVNKGFAGCAEMMLPTGKRVRYIISMKPRTSLLIL